MKTSLSILLFTLALLLSLPGATLADSPESGSALFQQHCAVCHPGGGNSINPQYTLNRASMSSHGIKTAADIVDKMRHPGPGMTRFSRQVISNRDADKIAQYILTTFK
ncbi:MAG: c-type cytochrome [Syntrophales bacterium]